MRDRAFETCLCLYHNQVWSKW